MNYKWIGLRELENLQPDAVQAWLKARGWKDDGPEGPAARAYVKRGGEPGDEVLLPTRPTAPDYEKIMAILVSKVAQVERMPPEAVLNDLSAAGYDVFRVRALEADEGSLGLNGALVLVQQARAALQAAARAAASKTPRRSYLGRPAESVTKLLEHVRVGQTERGSFVLPILVPYAFDPGDSEAMIDGFGRRAMRSLAMGLIGVDRALAASSTSEPAAPFAEAAGQGVSADLCQSLGKLLADAGDVELSIRWAAAQPEDRLMTNVQFSASSGPTLLRVAQLLREQDPPPPEPIVGIVAKLDDTPTTSSSKMVINGLIEGKWRNIELVLEERYRSEASEAFKDRKPVIVEGKLVQHGAKLIMSNVTLFQSFNPDEYQ
jgi:hypothetical protein